MGILYKFVVNLPHQFFCTFYYNNQKLIILNTSFKYININLYVLSCRVKIYNDAKVDSMSRERFDSVRTRNDNFVENYVKCLTLFKKKLNGFSFEIKNNKSKTIFVI